MTRTSFADGCHKYGWIITLIVSVLLQIIIAAYLAGSLSQKVDGLQEYLGGRVNRLEQQMDSLMRKP